jgi:hypothetical protein
MQGKTNPVKDQSCQNRKIVTGPTFSIFPSSTYNILSREIGGKKWFPDCTVSTRYK